MSLPYGPPFAVSPLIRGLRWGLLIAGIFYARGKQRLYDSLEATHREEQAKLQVIKDREMKALKKRIAKEEAETVKLLESGKLFEVDGDDFDSPPPPSIQKGYYEDECEPPPPRCA